MNNANYRVEPLVAMNIWDKCSTSFRILLVRSLDAFYIHVSPLLSLRDFYDYDRPAPSSVRASSRGNAYYYAWKRPLPICGGVERLFRPDRCTHHQPLRTCPRFQG